MAECVVHSAIGVAFFYRSAAVEPQQSGRNISLEGLLPSKEIFSDKLQRVALEITVARPAQRAEPAG
jgi:hypothetical protein